MKKPTGPADPEAPSSLEPAAGGCSSRSVRNLSASSAVPAGVGPGEKLGTTESGKRVTRSGAAALQRAAAAPTAAEETATATTESTVAEGATAVTGASAAAEAIASEEVGGASSAEETERIGSTVEEVIAAVSAAELATALTEAVSSTETTQSPSKPGSPKIPTERKSAAKKASSTKKSKASKKVTAPPKKKTTTQKAFARAVAQANAAALASPAGKETPSGCVTAAIAATNKATTLCAGCGDEAGRVHVCPDCDRSVHPWCGYPVGEEGYGQPVRCPSCDEVSKTGSTAKGSLSGQARQSAGSDEEAKSESDLEDERPEVADGSASNGSSSSEEGESSGSDGEFVITGVQPTSRLQPTDEAGVLTRGQEANLANYGVRVIVPAKTQTSSGGRRGKEREFKLYRIFNRYTVGGEYAYECLWAEGDITQTTTEWRDRLLEDGQKNRLDAVDRWMDYKEKVEKTNANLPANKQQECLPFNKWVMASRVGRRLMADDDNNRCMFTAMKTILEKGLGFDTPFTNQDMEKFCEGSRVGEGGIGWSDFLQFVRQIDRRLRKKKRAGVDLKVLSENLHKGLGKGVDSIWLLDETVLVDGWYLCGSLDSSYIGHAFALEVDDGLLHRWEDGERKPLDEDKESIWRMSFIRRVVRLEYDEEVEDPAPKDSKKKKPRGRRGSKKNQGPKKSSG
ncbi:hypothetical protein PHYBOEH_011231 [Phytophthora boehmeriae]|uniref:SCAN domain-containing protein n=1 Tax=Phytophthora boehmeriae TaxID=109152 RepID=A0A8T1VNM9_9STRA|nr:hypothetical protein PHYBOEH_011231 [Phytophthora boehmeriae]